MKTSEPITLLQDLPQDLEVYVDGYEGGVDTPFDPVVENATLNQNDQWYYGQHELDSDATTQCVYIGRKRND